jgi:ATP-dependent DNA helicase RecG
MTQTQKLFKVSPNFMGTKSGPRRDQAGTNTTQFTRQVKPESQPESLEQKKISSRLNQVIRELLKKDIFKQIVPDKPNSRLQKYRLTKAGKNIRLIGGGTHDLEV